MLLIGMFDSLFVRRVAVSMKVLDIHFEHANWSVGKDFDRIRQYSALGRVPALVLDDGEVLVESAAILDYLDQRVGPERALLPAAGEARRHALQAVSLAIGAAEKGRDALYEWIMRPADKRHQPWAERCRGQMHGALRELEARYATRGLGHFLHGERLAQADITTTCVLTFLSESVGLGAEGAQYPCLATLTDRCESLPAFKETRSPWFAPQTSCNS